MNFFFSHTPGSKNLKQPIQKYFFTGLHFIMYKNEANDERWLLHN
jgi:hypothetical protein